MANPIDPHFRARLRALDEQYAAGVPSLMQAIGRALACCQEQGPAVAALATLRQSLHTVAGSAATFGFGALGGECRRLEQCLRRLMEVDDEAARARRWPALAAEVGRLLGWAAANPKAGADAGQARVCAFDLSQDRY